MSDVRPYPLEEGLTAGLPPADVHPADVTPAAAIVHGRAH